MAAIKINGVSYDVERLSDEVKAHLQRLSFIDAETERLHLQMDVLRVARDEIGARLDRALLHMELNQPTPTLAAEPGAAV
jgi:hypothetical protein